MRRLVPFATALAAVLSLSILGVSQQTDQAEKSLVMSTNSSPASDGLEKATFGTGCFWCTEA